jgi:hypothetical protein
MHYYVTRELLPSLILYSAMFFVLCVVALAGFLLWCATRHISRSLRRPVALARLGYAESGGNPAGSERRAVRE